MSSRDDDEDSQMPNALHLCTSKAAPHISPSANLLFLAHLI
jgi:hypothetical protein